MTSAIRHHLSVSLDPSAQEGGKLKTSKGSSRLSVSVSSVAQRVQLTHHNTTPALQSNLIAEHLALCIVSAQINILETAEQLLQFCGSLSHELCGAQRPAITQLHGNAVQYKATVLLQFSLAFGDLVFP